MYSTGPARNGGIDSLCSTGCREGSTLAVLSGGEVKRLQGRVASSPHLSKEGRYVCAQPRLVPSLRLVHWQTGQCTAEEGPTRKHFQPKQQGVEGMEPERMQESDQTNVKLGEENFAESTNPKLRILKYRKTVPQLSIEWDNFPKKTLRLLWD